ncbi:MAG: vacuolar protein sorting/targeting protein PEP1, partial [Vezdaea acicularis]
LNVAESHPCPGKEPEYAEKHRIGGFALFCAITLPIIAATAIGYYVWSRWRTMFGQIRLGDAGSSLSGGDWTKYPVMLVAGIIAGLAVLPEVVGRLWRWATGAGRRYTRRTDFGRTRGDYEAVVREDEDVGGLLGEESDEE